MRTLVVSAVVTLAAVLPSVARAQDLPALAQDEGFAAAHAALLDLVARTRPRTLSQALTSARLDQVKMPVTRADELRELLPEVGAAQGCLWAADKVNCSIPRRVSGSVASGDLEVACRAEGTEVIVRSTLVQIAGRWELLLPDLGACWRVDGTALALRRSPPPPPDPG
jgi:hypothetical protein